jgi:hypothetical protein
MIMEANGFMVKIRARREQGPFCPFTLTESGERPLCCADKCGVWSEEHEKCALASIPGSLWELIAKLNELIKPETK